jgi:hypothetical protein
MDTLAWPAELSLDFPVRALMLPPLVITLGQYQRRSLAWIQNRGEHTDQVSRTPVGDVVLDHTREPDTGGIQLVTGLRANHQRPPGRGRQTGCEQQRHERPVAAPLHDRQVHDVAQTLQQIRTSIRSLTPQCETVKPQAQINIMPGSSNGTNAAADRSPVPLPTTGPI